MGEFTYIGYGRRQLIKRLFKAWHRELLGFEKRLYDDLPYWYGERTNIGVLTGAALRLKTTALEEYAVRRGGVKGSGAGSSAGRADLYIYDSKANRSYDFEFKFCYSAIGWYATKRVKNAMRSATHDVHTLPKPTWPCVGMAVVFVVPYRKKFPPGADWKALWEKFVDFIGEPGRFGADFVAIHHASGEIVRRAGKGIGKSEGLGFHPGIAAVGKMVRHHP